MKRLLPLLAAALSACSAHAGPYIIAPAPLPTPVPGADAAPVSATAAALSGTAEALSPTAAATLAPTVTPAPFFYLLPWVDKRKQRQLWKGQSPYLDVDIVAEGLSLSAQAWQERDYRDYSYLWHHQLQAAYMEAGEPRVAAAEQPMDEQEALSAAANAGAKYVLAGRLEQGQVDKRGHDPLAGTNFSGTDYTLRMKAKLRAVEVASGKALPEISWDYKQLFFDPTRLGSPDYKTFPGFFTVGLHGAAADLVGQKDLRALAGLPAYTPTPTVTPTAMTTPPTPGPSPTPVATFTPTAEPTPDFQPYWVNPKTGKTVDPNWNFDPEDGTPRKDFILRQPKPKPTPMRQLDQR